MNLVPLDEIIEMWKKDSEVDSTDPGKEILRIPILHSKYTRILAAHSMAAKHCSVEYYKLKKIKWEYYSGRLDDQELKKLGWEPFRFLLKSDINVYMEGDLDLIKINAKKALHEEAFNYCTSIVKELTSRTYQIRAFMDWEKFIQGQ